MSGCKFNNTNTNQYMRVDRTATMRLYLGINNDFGILNRIYSQGNIITLDDARTQGVIVDTFEDYKGIVSPND